jgi:murein L,D-transpeptidase YcbB/YkuD
MRYFYLTLLLLATLAYPFSFLSAMERTPQTLPEATVSAYSELESLLADYKSKAQKGGWPSFKPSTQKIEPGAIEPRIETIRTILTATGDYSASLADAISSDSPMHYDDKLVEAVKRFQLRHGLTDDGIIGKETQIALNTPIEKRIKQIEGTIARMREFTPDPSGRYLIVNLPEFVLRGFKENRPVMEMKVIVGTPKDHTPVFTKQMTYVSFNPHWGVPIRIAAEEMLPKILENPNFFAEQDFAVYELHTDGTRSEIDPATVDWASHGKDNFPYLLRQRPGKDNALGKIKFGLKNSNDIYMHDTSNPKLFAKEVRAFSHGCMRLEKPYEMAKFVFEGKENFTQEELDALYTGDESRIVTIPPLTVHVVYWTAWIGADGQPNFRKDIYGLDS